MITMETLAVISWPRSSITQKKKKRVKSFSEALKLSNLLKKAHSVAIQIKSCWVEQYFAVAILTTLTLFPNGNLRRMVRFVIGHSWEVGGRSVKELTKHVPWDFRSPPCISGSCSPFRLEAEQPRSAGHLARLHCSASVCPSLENDSSLTVPFDFHIYQKKRQKSEQRDKSFWYSLTLHPSKQQMFVLEHEDLMPNES